MSLITQEALHRARHLTSAHVFSNETVKTPHEPITLPPIIGPINHYMRMQARADAIDTVLTLRALLASATGRAQIINQLMRAALGRPSSHIAGIRDVILMLQEHDHGQTTIS